MASPKPRQLTTAESLAMLQEKLTSQPSTASSPGASDQHAAVAIALHRGRVLALAALLAALVAALAVALSRGGVELRRFRSDKLSADEQHALLDSYNSYSGTVASALERPIEVAVAMLVQVVVLRVWARDVLGVAPAAHVRLAVLLVGGAAGYLLANGLNALNVQVRELPVAPVVTYSDLPAVTVANRSRTVGETVAESTPHNPLNNTLLRSLVRQRVAARAPMCGASGYMEDDAVVFAVPQQSWMATLLPEALEPARMRVTVAPNLSVTVDGAFPPTNASVLADVLALAFYAGDSYWPWNTSVSPVMFDAASAYDASPFEGFRMPTARLIGLLPPSPNATEEQDRAFFTERSAQFLPSFMTSEATNGSLLELRLEFAHVDVTPLVHVDAVTVEREVEVTHLQVFTGRDNATRYFAYDGFEYRASSPRYVFIPKSLDAADPVVHAFAMCTNFNGTDALEARVYLEDQVAEAVSCFGTSSSSMFVVSTARRLVADAFFENATANDTGLFIGETSTRGVVANLREVVTTTYARVSWEYRDLAAAYGAECGIKDGCRGLDAPLVGDDSIVIQGVDALPTDQLETLQFQKYPDQPLALVSVRRPQSAVRVNSNTDSKVWLGDVLMPHNVARVNVTSLHSPYCYAAQERRLQLLVENHLYSESPLQAAYSAATLFLFQNAIAKDMLVTDAGATTLAFDGNSQDLTIQLSIPLLNVVLTLAGCVLLLAIVAAVVWWPAVAADPWDHVATPHVVARVIADETTFPPMLLRRTVAHASGVVDANNVEIEDIVVSRTDAQADATNT